MSSLSKDLEVAGCFTNNQGAVFEIDVIDGKIIDFSIFPEEREILLMPFSLFKVIAID